MRHLDPDHLQRIFEGIPLKFLRVEQERIDDQLELLAERARIIGGVIMHKVGEIASEEDWLK